MGNRGLRRSTSGISIDGRQAAKTSRRPHSALGAENSVDQAVQTTGCWDSSLRPGPVNLRNFILQPWQLVFAILAGWIHQRQQEAIAYLRTENQVLRETLGPKRILLDDDQRRRLAVQGQVLGRKGLQEFATLFSRHDPPLAP